MCVYTCMCVCDEKRKQSKVPLVSNYFLESTQEQARSHELILVSTTFFPDSSMTKGEKKPGNKGRKVERSLRT